MTSTSTATSTGTRVPATWSTTNKVGLAIATVYAITNIPTAFIPTTEGEGPPLAISIVCSVLSVVGLVAAVMAWRGSRAAARLAAASLVVVTLTGLPAFFVDVPAGIKILVAAGVVITILFVVLIFAPSRRD